MRKRPQKLFEQLGTEILVAWVRLGNNVLNGCVLSGRRVVEVHLARRKMLFRC